MASNEIRRRLIVTGSPGVGKTTIIKKVCTSLSDAKVPVLGFYTDEVRRNGYRIGFDIVSLDGTRARLARSDDCGEQIPVSQHKVGKYSVLTQEFESVVLPIFEKIIHSTGGVVVIDEIGKMELFSDKFVSNIKNLFKRNDLIILSTIPVAKGRPIPLVESIRNDKNNYLTTVNTTNRGQIPQQLEKVIMSFL